MNEQRHREVQQQVRVREAGNAVQLEERGGVAGRGERVVICLWGSLGFNSARETHDFTNIKRRVLLML